MGLSALQPDRPLIIMLKPTQLFFLITFLFLTACGPDFVFEKNYEIPNAEWSYADTLDFEFDIQDTNQLYNFYLDIEHEVGYKNQNIYFMIHTQYPSSKRIAQQLSIDLANKAGAWFGKCGNESCKLRVNLQEKAFFNETGKHTLTLEQYMRVDPLPGIKNLALRIEKLEERR